MSLHIVRLKSYGKNNIGHDVCYELYMIMSDKSYTNDYRY